MAHESAKKADRTNSQTGKAASVAVGDGDEVEVEVEVAFPLATFDGSFNYDNVYFMS